MMTAEYFVLTPGKLTLENIIDLLKSNTRIKLAEKTYKKINQAVDTVKEIIAQKTPVYGVNTGFGALVNIPIPYDKLEELQKNLLLSHAAGVGDLLNNEIVKLILLLKINSLACGHSGVRAEVIDALIAFYNHQIYPEVPAKGSAGASGDLAPLAHLCLPLIGVGKVNIEGKTYPGIEALKKIGLTPMTLVPKEGLGLINGTQVSTAIALYGLLQAKNNFDTEIVAGALSVDAIAGCYIPFDSRIHKLRGQVGQIEVAERISKLLKGSQIRPSVANCRYLQDPYSIRCQPQVMGAILDQLNYATNILTIEANAVTDNPLIFTDTNEALSGGNFHAEPVAFVADGIALALTEMGNLSERRIALMINQHLSDLPAFLVKNSGINSGFMCAEVTAATLASENRLLSHPATADNIPTSANQEDHVSMATTAAYRLLTMNKNVSYILAIELLAACQGIDLRKPLVTSNILQTKLNLIRQHVPFYSEDRFFADDIEKVFRLVTAGAVY